MESDAWRNSDAYELAKKQQQVDHLHTQVHQLRELVEKLAKQQNEKTAAEAPARSIRPAGFMRPAPQLSSVPTGTVKNEFGPSVSDQVVRMQSQIDALLAAQAAAQQAQFSASAGGGQQAGQTSGDDSISKSESEPKAKSGSKPSVLGRIGRFFRRG